MADIDVEAPRVLHINPHTVNGVTTTLVHGTLVDDEVVVAPVKIPLDCEAALACTNYPVYGGGGAYRTM